MYLASQFTGNRHHAAQLIRQHPFASLISLDDTGLPYITHLPLHLEADANASASGTAMVLLGHVARANPHWRYLEARSEAVVTFLGPHAYLSPQVYPDLARVPTWNYLAVHCKVQARVVQESAAKDALLKKLIGDHEPAYAAQWRGLEAKYTHGMLAGIVGFELEVTGLQCKLKLNQHRPEALDSTLAMYSNGTDNERELAQWLAQISAENQLTGL